MLLAKGKSSGCGDGSSCMTRNLRDVQTFLGVQVTRNVDYSAISMTQRLWSDVPAVANYQLFPGEPKWEKTTRMLR